MPGRREKKSTGIKFPLGRNIEDPGLFPYERHDGNPRDGFWESGARLAELQTTKIHPEGSLLAPYSERITDSMSRTYLSQEM